MVDPGGASVTRRSLDRAALLAAAPASLQARNATPAPAGRPAATRKAHAHVGDRPGARTGPLDATAGVVRRAASAAYASGESLEAWLAAAHDAMRRAGVADVVKVGPPVAPTRIGRRVLFVATGTAPPDYLGTLAGGRAVAVEAKRRSGRLHRESVRADGVACRDGIDAHQREALAAWERIGALALVFVEFRRARATTRHAVPWSALESLWVARDGVRSVGPRELAAWVVGEGAYLARWASVVEVTEAMR